MVLDFLKRLFFVVPEKPRVIQIEITNKCNLDCAMCPRKNFDLVYEDMKPDILKQVAEKIPCSSEVILTGWGEPFLYPAIFEAVALFKQKKCFVKLTTNGAFLNPETSKKLINSGLDSISISVDSFGALNDNDPRHKNLSIRNAVSNFISLRAGSNSDAQKGRSPDLKRRGKPLVILQPTLHKGKEAELFELIKEGKRLGVDRINIVRLDKRFNKNFDYLNGEEEYAIAKKIIALSSKEKIRVDFLPFTAFTGLKRTLFGIFRGLLYSKNRPCAKIYDYIYVVYSGKATPCCSLPKYEIGDLLSQSLEEIWSGPTFKKFRENHDLVCKNCDMLRLPER